MTKNMDRARELSRRQNEAERIVWTRLRGRRFVGFKFRRKVPLGAFIVDFVGFEKQLVIELDGGQYDAHRTYDSERDAWLRSQGFDLLRFWNNEVFTEWECIEEAIWARLHSLLRPGSLRPSQNTSPPTPLPQGERGVGMR
jgi:very-short-patch-repair endonuclease